MSWNNWSWEHKRCPERKRLHGLLYVIMHFQQKFNDSKLDCRSEQKELPTLHFEAKSTNFAEMNSTNFWKSLKCSLNLNLKMWGKISKWSISNVKINVCQSWEHWHQKPLANYLTFISLQHLVTLLPSSNGTKLCQ